MNIIINTKKGSKASCQHISGQSGTAAYSGVQKITERKHWLYAVYPTNSGRHSPYWQPNWEPASLELIIHLGYISGLIGMASNEGLFLHNE